MAEPIDFAALAAALLDRARSLVPEWLPDGKMVAGKEYQVRNPTRGDARAGSFSVNLDTGAWADFAVGDCGGDLISLYAYLHGLNNGQAARELMQRVGLGRVEAAPPAPAPRQGRVEPPAGPAGGKPRREAVWRTLMPVPPHAPAATFRHQYRGEAERDGTWAYERDGHLLGYVVRFRTSDGGKEILPYTWCQDDAQGSQRWHWRQWDEPRPLYLAAGLLAADARLTPVVLVEGEKCAAAGHALLPAEYDWVTWPGGSKAWGKASWEWLQGRVVYLWPDTDAKREPLSKAEREAGIDPATKPLLPEHKQPGMAAMVGIGRRLLELGCVVTMCPVPAPGEVPDGWDVADAIAQGWDAERVRAFIRGARPFVLPDEHVGRADADLPLQGPPGGGGGDGSGGGAGEAADGERPRRPSWRDLLLRNRQGVQPVAENYVAALDGGVVDGTPVPGIEACAGLIRYDEFACCAVKAADSPWGTPAGPWLERDDLLLRDWLVRHHYMPSCTRQALHEAVQVVAHRHPYHPVRDRLEALRGTWDRCRRLPRWLGIVCMGDQELQEGSDLEQYLARVGTWFVMGMCARVLRPGCKFDLMLMLEGKQGRLKSTLARVLSWGYFADTGIEIGDKDSYQNIQGVWCYEIGEFNQLARADIRGWKNFLASGEDRFRAPFDRLPQNYPRQCVFIGTTNDRQYLADVTGNRRFWPVRVTREEIDLDWVREHQDQLFAEALHYLDKGARYWPTAQEQEAIFDPQQRMRQIDSALETAVRRFLLDPEAKGVSDGTSGVLVTEISSSELLARVGYTVDKQSAHVMRELSAILDRMGWAHQRATRKYEDGSRPYVWVRPPRGPGVDSGPSTPTPGATGEDPDECPF